MPSILSCYPRDGQRYFIPLPPTLSKEKKIRFAQRCHLCVQTLLSRNSYVIFTCILYSRPYLKEIFCHHRSAADGLTRSRSLKKTLNTPTAIKKNSQCLQLIYQVVSGLLLIFIHFFLYRCRLDPHSRFFGYSLIGLFEPCPQKVSQNPFTWLFFCHRTRFWTPSERPRSISFAAFYRWILPARWTAETLSWEIRLGKIYRHWTYRWSEHSSDQQKC